ncbi:MAG: DUF3237 domain-containing protein [Caldilineaceae bacterium]
MFQPTVLQLEPLMQVEVTLAPALELGVTPVGKRRIIHIMGGHFQGAGLCGVVLSGGADWQIVRADGVAILEARYTLQCEDGALIYVQNRGVRHGPPDVLAALARGEEVDPATYYMRTTPIFETSDSNYAWLNDIVAVGSGIRRADAVVLDFYRVQ